MSKGIRTAVPVVGTILVVIIVVIGFMVNKHQSPERDTPEPADSRAIELVDTSGTVTTQVRSNVFRVSPESGSPDVVIQIFEDYMSLESKEFEEKNSDALLQAVKDGKVVIEYHILNSLDPESASGDYSSRSLTAVSTMVKKDKEKFLSYHKWLYANQPRYSSLNDEELKVGLHQVKVNEAALQEFDNRTTCYGLVKQSARNSLEDIYKISKSVSVPLVAVDGRAIDVSEPGWIEKVS